MRVVKKGQAEKGCTVVYIGRPSVLGNPFVIGRDGDRAAVVTRYHQWLREQWVARGPVRAELEALAARVVSGERLAFECWCAAKPRAPYAIASATQQADACHGDVVAHAVSQLIKKGGA